MLIRSPSPIVIEADGCSPVRLFMFFVKNIENILWSKMLKGDEIKLLIMEAVAKLGFELKEGNFHDLPVKKVAEAL